MKQMLVIVLLALATLAGKAQDATGIKPGISINGVPCLIQNLIYSCTPRTCDSLVIMAGDSIEFCTHQQIFLNTDTAYWMRWQFSGATNLPDTILNDYPSQTPICYWPRWDTAGTFMVEAFYNGVLTAYPSSDCYSFGPSHWYVKLIVLPNPNDVPELGTSGINVTPNPASEMISISGAADPLALFEITNVLGEVMMNVSCGENSIGTLPNGLYFVRVKGPMQSVVVPLIIAR